MRGRIIPISRKDFDSGLEPTTKRILEFLESHDDQAFTSMEIGTKLQIAEIYDMMNYLFLEAKIVRRNKIAGTFYYSAKQQ